MECPIYLIFAGVNGAGKSTFYKTDFWKTDDLPHNLPRINPDEIVIKNGGNPYLGSDQIRAGIEAVRRLNKYLEEEKSNHLKETSHDQCQT